VEAMQYAVTAGTWDWLGVASGGVLSTMQARDVQWQLNPCETEKMARMAELC